MNKKLVTVITLCILIIVGIAIFLSMGALGAQTNSDSGIFPQIIGATIVVLSIISIIQSLRKENIIVPMTNIKLVIATIIATIVYLFVWTEFSLFYPATFLYVMGLFWLYSKDRKNWKRLVVMGLPVTVGTILFVYLLFEKAMSIRF